MKNNNFFPQRPVINPIIYAYSDTRYPGCLKIGDTTRPIEVRMKEHYPTITPGVSYKVELIESAMYDDGSSFRDYKVHEVLKNNGITCVAGEWFKCDVKTVKRAIFAVKNGQSAILDRINTFGMRPEQKKAVEKTIEYYKSEDASYLGQIPKFLWNCKMRFGKTFAAYELAKQMDFKRVLVLTFKPAVQSAWKEDLLTHVDFEGWQFISRPADNHGDSIDIQYQKADKSKPIVCFGSFQDFLGVDNNTGGIKSRNEWVHTTNWDLVIFDEYHFGAWGDNAKKLFDQGDEEKEEVVDEKYDRGNAYDETFLPITTSYYLYLSGTPFRALNSGEFIEDQIFNWTYSDEQRAKEKWKGPQENPYESLPRMVMMTYKIPDSISQIASQGEFNEFDLNVFFSAKSDSNKVEEAQFVYKDYVQKWLDLIRGSYLPTSVDDLKLGAEKPPMPYSDTRLLNVLSHTLWYLPGVLSCFAMKNLLDEKQNNFYHDYTINVCAGTGAGIGLAALDPVRKSMADPLESKTITLTCGKLTTGVTVKPWTGVFMLRNMSSPESYFQTAFRCQSPWVIEDEFKHKTIIKKECYVFDFALNRALKQISDYSCRLNVDESNPEKKVDDFIHFLPVLAYDGSAMRQVNASEILDITMAGTSATLLARRWESALLVNVDNATLMRLLNNKEAMEALMKIEGFRSLNDDITTIINKSEKVKKAKKEGKDLTQKQRKELTEEEKEYKSKRKEIQEKLIKFATRVPVFMYLTDYREYSLKDVITQLEPGLFKKVTGLDVKDFELLVSLNVFNESLMNDAVYKFKRYEDASLTYAGIDKHEGEKVGLFSTVISRSDYDQMAGELADSMKVDNNLIVKTSKQAMLQRNKPSTPKVEATKPVQLPSHNNVVKPSNNLTANQPVNSNIKGKKFDVQSIKIGTKVLHKAFGEGTVDSFKDDFINITFIIDYKKVQKTFKYPAAFIQGFLAKKEV